jgi:enoyl-CoA hydratase/carnithine racemase
VAGLNESVHYAVEGSVAYLMMNRPQASNAQDRAIRDGLVDGCRRAEQDPQVRVMVLGGVGGRAFSAGADLKEMAAAPELGPEEKFRHYRALQAMTKPVIAAIDGVCLAGGLELALACDIRLATAGSTFGLPEPRWGLTGGIGLVHLSRVIPLGEAMLIHLTGAPVDARRAYEIGLVQRLLPDRAALDRECAQVAEQIGAGSSAAVAAIKDVVRSTPWRSPEEAESYATTVRARTAKTAAWREGPQSFVAERPGYRAAQDAAPDAQSTPK